MEPLLIGRPTKTHAEPKLPAGFTSFVQHHTKDRLPHKLCQATGTQVSGLPACLRVFGRRRCRPCVCVYAPAGQRQECTVFPRRGRVCHLTCGKAPPRPRGVILTQWRQLMSLSISAIAGLRALSTRHCYGLYIRSH